LRSYVWGLDLSGSSQGAGGVGGLLCINALSPLASSLFPVYDGNGNIMALVDSATGTTAANYEYGPFGEPLKATGSAATANPFRFSTKYTDSETGLLYYGYRYYSTSLRRWISQDPIEERGGVNLYGFVENTPVNYMDYLGLIGAQTVGKCEIIIFVGHGPHDEASIEKWKVYTEKNNETIPAVIETPNVCSGATAIGCNAGKPGVVTYGDGRGGAGNQIPSYSPPSNSFDLKKIPEEIGKALTAARSYAREEICPKACCETVKIKVQITPGFRSFLRDQMDFRAKGSMRNLVSRAFWGDSLKETLKYNEYEEAIKCR
jgi:RHS repeat-associated protein